MIPRFYTNRPHRRQDFAVPTQDERWPARSVVPLGRSMDGSMG
jgi:hypothetical protein